tara:strand:+ start:732 stop:1226 length:495 start_codon:yes stop_codon:yes gene_type:complete
MKKDLNGYVSTYKELLTAGDVQIAYAQMIKYVQKLRTRFSKELGEDYAVGNVFQGYMDYTYFYLTNSLLQARKLKLGIVFRHGTADFDVWLLGQTKAVQVKYWNMLKNTNWINGTKIPAYSIFEAALVRTPDFNDLDTLTDTLCANFRTLAPEILESIRQLEGS